MKRNVLTLLGIFNLSLTFSQGMLKDERLGLVSFLTTVKYMTEYKIVSFTSEKNYSDSQPFSKKIQADYNAIMVRVNKLINQLSVDMISKNNLCEFRNLNKFVNKSKSNLPKKFSSYVEALKEIDALTLSFLKEDKEIPKTLPGIAYSDIIGIGTLAETSIASARDFREKKVTNIIAILKELRLKSISELNKKDEPKK